MIMEDRGFVHHTHIKNDNKIKLVVGKRIEYNEGCDERGRKIAINGKSVSEEAVGSATKSIGVTRKKPKQKETTKLKIAFMT